MTADIKGNSPKITVRLAKHIAAAIVTSIPILFMLYIAVLSPGYYAAMFSMDPRVLGAGSVFILFMLLLLGLLYGSVILIGNTIVALVRGAMSAGKLILGMVKVVLLGGVMLLLLYVAMVTAVIGPAGAILVQSPVGRMFFGG